MDDKMIYHLLWYLRDVFTHQIGFYAYQNVGFRSVSAILTSLLIALLIGPKIIRWLMRKKIGDRAKADVLVGIEAYLVSKNVSEIP